MHETTKTEQSLKKTDDDSSIQSSPSDIDTRCSDNIEMVQLVKNIQHGCDFNFNLKGRRNVDCVNLITFAVSNL